MTEFLSLFPIFKGYRLFFKLRFSTQTATLFAHKSLL
nr:MAG TPA: hypothetical protein [Caudoviricetes sp.]